MTNQAWKQDTLTKTYEAMGELGINPFIHIVIVQVILIFFSIKICYLDL